MAGGIYEKYGQSNTGVDLYWTKYVPPGAQDGQKFPAIIGLHGGGWLGGSSVLNQQGTPCAANGFLFFGTEYRLAPPSKEMNTPLANGNGFTPGNHLAPGQDTVNDHGYAPEPMLDVSMAVRAARAHPQCDGRVYGLGGSAGAALVIHNLLVATEGDDKFDLGVCCSIGVFDMWQSEMWFIPPAANETNPSEAVANHLNISNTYPSAPTGADLVVAKNNSPSFFFNASKIGGRIWVMLSDRDSVGIPTSCGEPIPSYEKTGGGIAVNEGTPPYTVATGFKPTAIAAGMTESTEDVPEPGTLKYKFTVVPASDNGVEHAHAFAVWPLLLDDGRAVGQAIIEWFGGGPGSAGGSPVIEDFEPKEGFAGVTEVIITGTGFASVVGVRFDHIDALSFVIDSDTQITAIPPIGGTSGRIVVRAANGDQSTTPTDFTVHAQTIEVQPPEIPLRQPILDYPKSGLAPLPPTVPSAPLQVACAANGVAGSRKALATWVPPADTSGFVLLNYIVSCVADDGSGSVELDDVFGGDTQLEIDQLEFDTLYNFSIQATNTIGASEAVVVQFTSSPASAPEVKDQPYGALCLFDSPINPVTGRHEVEWNPTNFWGNVNLRGSRYRSSWQNICENPLDPTDTTYYDWSEIDAYLAKCVTYGQFAGISVAAGIYCPAWLYTVPSVRTINQSGPDPGLMPVPWSEKYLDLWIQFINAFGERYDSHDQLLYFTVGGLGQVVETILAQDASQDLPTLLEDAQARGFGSINEAWLFAANRILFACSRAFKHTHFLLSLAKIIPDSWDNGSGSQACRDVTDIGKTISPTNFGIMNAGLNENSNYNPPGGFVPNELIHDNSAALACGFQFGHGSGQDETIFADTIDNGATELKGKFLEMYRIDATSVDAAYIADIANANTLLDANP